MISSPLGLIAELTHRCPLRCAYCSNPLELTRKSKELSTKTWLQVIRQAKELDMVQIYFTGGEPCLRPDLVELVHAARVSNLYVNLITSGVGLSQKLCQSLCEAGVDHIQLSLQDVDKDGAFKICGVNALEAKIASAKIIRESSAAFTVNIVVHRLNLERLPNMIESAIEFGANKIEIAHVQFNGWALQNRDWLLPSKSQVLDSEKIILTAKEKYKGQVRFDYVLPDYYAQYPKACMNGWGKKMMLIDPQGRAMPCHSAVSIPKISFPNVTEKNLYEIWHHSDLFNQFRGTDWMPEVCQSCPRKESDYGGCRCQALALTGTASEADPVCHRSSYRPVVDEAIIRATQTNKSLMVHRSIS